jgi:hypothetical protein
MTGATALETKIRRGKSMDTQARRGKRQREVKPGTGAMREALQAVMDRNGWRDLDAAEACSDPAQGWKISDGTINNYRHGYEYVSRAKMPMIERGFGIPVPRLIELMHMGGDGEPEREQTIADLLYEAERALRRARELYDQSNNDPLPAG